MEGLPRQEAVCIGASSMTASGEGGTHSSAIRSEGENAECI